MREDLLERINHLLGDDGENDREFLRRVGRRPERETEAKKAWRLLQRSTRRSPWN